MVVGSNQLCCCGRMDVKTGALVIGILYAIFGFLCLFNNFVAFTIFQESARNSIIEVIISAVVIAVGVLTFDGSYNDRSRKIIPMMVFLAGQIVFFFILTGCFVAAVFDPDLILHNPVVKDRTEKITTREVKAISAGLAFLFVLLITLSLWFLTAMVNCYRCIREGKKSEETEMGHFENARY
ncbi:hypothetical protein QR680_004124 [Steinernema hermaphroditum]|uniref:Uncharacterized protein n=1 Tax=Steinernema hermaphroditum TaxID=289476 RepID=A0AA39HMQ6_9BILA|nr:hypothetical protein QR680_004124 [Steinernema hermaphroditum]